MSIRPLDMQVMVPKMNEVAQIKNMEQQKAGINQQEIQDQQNKENIKTQQTVIKAQEDDRLENHADAKEKGKSTYNPRKKKKNVNLISKDDFVEENSGHKIDIKL